MSNGIAAADGRERLITEAGDTDDIIKAILSAVKDVRGQTADFSRQFTGDRAGLKKLFWWVKENIEYKEDPLGVQWIREPARLWHDGVGDCKSYTLFIVSVLENMGLRYSIKFVNTERPGKRTVNHVYPVAILDDGEKVVIDAVYHTFNAEHPYHYAKTYKMAEIYRLSGLGSTNTVASQELQRYKSELQAIAAQIPDEVTEEGGDITAMSAGEFLRWQQAQLFEALAETSTDGDDRTRYAAAAAYITQGSGAGIGAFSSVDAAKLDALLATAAGMQAPAFPSPVLFIPEMSGVGSLKDVVGDIIDDIKTAWKKVVNWLFKQAMPKAAPFFLYAFLKGAPGSRTAKRAAKQTAVLTWIQKAGQFDSADAVKNAARIGIVKAYGKQPEAVLDSAAGGKVSGVGAVVAAIVKVVTIVIDVVQTIAKLFKKKGPDVNAQSDAPDFDELRAEYTASIKPGTTGPKTIPYTDRGGGLPEWALPVAVVAAVLILKK